MVTGRMETLSSQDIAEIQRIPVTYAFLTDTGRCTDCAELFAEDGETSGFVPGKTSVGKAAIRKSFWSRERQTKLRSLHVISPVHVYSDGTDQTRAKGAAYFQIFRNPASPNFDSTVDDPHKAPPDPMHGGGPAFVGMYLFTAKKQGARWLLTSWHFSPMFIPGNHCTDAASDSSKSRL